MSGGPQKKRTSPLVELSMNSVLGREQAPREATTKNPSRTLPERERQ